MSQTRQAIKRKNHQLLVVAVVLVAIIGIMIFGVLMKRYSPTKERADLRKHFAAEQEDVAALVVNGVLLPEQGLWRQERVYLPYEQVYRLDQRYYWDTAVNLFLYTDGAVVTKVNATEQTVTKGDVTEQVSYTPVLLENGQPYIALDFITERSNLTATVEKDPYRAVLTVYDGSEQTTAAVKSGGSVRVRAGIKSEVLEEVAAATTVTVLDTSIEGWTKVATPAGCIGYIENKKLEIGEKTLRVRDAAAVLHQRKALGSSVNLVWHQVTNADANDSVLNLISSTKGVNVVSPTWFSLADHDGNITSLADSTYVNRVHQQGKQVWGLVDNFNPDVKTKTVLAATASRNQLTNQLVAQALQYGLDGINVDFELLQEDTIPAFIQFLRELSIKCSNNQLILSVDLPVPTFSKYYNRKAIAEVVDYVCLMAYDEHFAGDTTSGSVASFPFVETAVIQTLREVPAEKLVLGVPFYTRIWTEAAGADGKTAVSSIAVGMGEAERLLAENSVTPVWAEEARQNYGEYASDKGVNKVWLEDSASIEAKLKLIGEHKLAGVAAWKLGFEESGIWDTIIKYVN
ncbi:MAG: glycosyl hydrolase family 18 protein [Lachnospiraceae bacterium]|nr:glycosyl hydrolase family 18 protein [Lachnospiraceae bacterium]MDY5742660.1 glycosyl hydrolase family 18 protein [Lachnospiraceae bacterium]